MVGTISLSSQKRKFKNPKNKKVTADMFITGRFTGTSLAPNFMYVVYCDLLNFLHFEGCYDGSSDIVDGPVSID